MRRLILLAAAVLVVQSAWSPQLAQAHKLHSRGGLHFGGGSYYGGRSFFRGASYYGRGSYYGSGSCYGGGSYYGMQSNYYPQSSYYRSYRYAPYYNNSGFSYGPSYGTAYGVSSCYSSCPSVSYSNAYPTVSYANALYPTGSLQQFNNYGMSSGGGSGSSQLGILNSSALTGANLAGSLLQPNYLSMPVAVGNGSSGFLQIPVGTPDGRASYLQIPVNSGNGPSSYLQIELGRNPRETPPDPPTPAPNLNPLGSLPAVNLPAVTRFLNDIHNTASDELPPVAPAVQNAPANMITAFDSGSEPTPAKADAADMRPGVTLSSADKGYHVVVKPNGLEAARSSHQQTLAAAFTKDTSFSLIDGDVEIRPQAEADRVDFSADEIVIPPGREGTPWVAKPK